MMVDMNYIPSVKRLQFANWRMTIDIVDFSSYNMVIFPHYVSLQESNQYLGNTLRTGKSPFQKWSISHVH